MIYNYECLAIDYLILFIFLFLNMNPGKPSFFDSDIVASITKIWEPVKKKEVILGNKLCT